MQAPRPRHQRLRWLNAAGHSAEEILRFVWASPSAPVWLFRAYILESIISWLVLFVQMLLFESATMTQAEASEAMWLTMVPMLAVFVRVPPVLIMENRCRQQYRAYAIAFQPVDRELELELRSPWAAAAWFISTFLALWYCLGIVWSFAKPPCRSCDGCDFSERVESAYMTGRAHCEFFESMFSLLVFANAFLALGSFLGLKAVQRWRSNFIPPGGGGIQPAALEFLPTYQFGEPGAPSSSTASEGDEPTCVICLNSYETGDKVRQLPCGHDFHAPCVDGWLRRSPTCPMRCDVDVKKACADAARAAGRTVEDGRVLPDRASPARGEPQPVVGAWAAGRTPGPGS